MVSDRSLIYKGKYEDQVLNLEKLNVLKFLSLSMCYNLNQDIKFLFVFAIKL
jgi:hypothetical protein